jgi:hypothetical protein
MLTGPLRPLMSSSTRCCSLGGLLLAACNTEQSCHLLLCLTVLSVLSLAVRLKQPTTMPGWSCGWVCHVHVMEWAGGLVSLLPGIAICCAGSHSKLRGPCIVVIGVSRRFSAWVRLRASCPAVCGRLQERGDEYRATARAALPVRGSFARVSLNFCMHRQSNVNMAVTASAAGLDSGMHCERQAVQAARRRGIAVNGVPIGALLSRQIASLPDRVPVT